MSKNIPLKIWIENFNQGIYDNADVKIQIEAGWYDWFCKDSSLLNKTKKLGQIIKQLKNSNKVNLSKNYVWFKNNCPLLGHLYDDFRITSIATRDIIFTVQISSPWSESKYTVYGTLNDFKEPLFQTNKLRELVKWFNEDCC